MTQVTCLILLVSVLPIGTVRWSAAIIAAGDAVEPVAAPDDPLGPHRLQYRRPDLVVDLGVGLWAWPLPMDWDGDGDYDLVVSCPGRAVSRYVSVRKPRRRREDASV